MLFLNLKHSLTTEKTLDAQGNIVVFSAERLTLDTVCK